MHFEQDARSGQTLLYLCIIVFVTSLWPSPANGDESGGQEVKIAVLSNHGYQHSIDRWSPTAAYLTREITGYSFAVLPLDPGDYEAAIDRGTVDFAISCPSLYAKLEVLYGVTRIATMKTHYTDAIYHVFAAVLVVKSDRTDIRKLDGLRGKRIRAMHGPDCTTWHVACSEFLRHGLEPTKDFKEIVFCNRPSEVLQAILSGEADVGIIRSDMYDEMSSNGELHPGEIHVLHEDDRFHSEVPFDHSTAAFPERVFAKLRRTSDELTELAAVALLQMPSEALVAGASRGGGWTIPHNYQPIHDILKVLRISPYDQFGQIGLGTVFLQYGPWIASIFFLAAAIIVSLGFTLVQTKRLHRAKRMILEQQIIETSDRTQQSIGEIIHNGLGQQLTAIRLLAETVREQSAKQGGLFTKSMCDILGLAREATRQSKQIAGNLYPAALSRQGLGDAVESYLSSMSSIFNVKYETQFPGGLCFENPDFNMHLYRIVQEAVHNAIKHGKARYVLVGLKEHTSSYILYIEDDGVGFDADEIDHTGIGLHIMRYRASAIRGDLTIGRSQAGGTRVTCRFDAGKSSSN
jgi:signal transduction histidine kinase